MLHLMDCEHKKLMGSENDSVQKLPLLLLNHHLKMNYGSDCDKDKMNQVIVKLFIVTKYLFKKSRKRRGIELIQILAGLSIGIRVSLPEKLRLLLKWFMSEIQGHKKDSSIFIGEGFRADVVRYKSYLG